MPEDDNDDDEGIDIRIALPAWDEALGGDAEGFARAILENALAAEQSAGGVAVLLTDDASVRAVNAQWRGKDAPTNVLSFPAPPSQGGGLGDIVLAYETVAAEAQAQAKPFTAHAAHLLIHGFLHLLGYDHIADDEAERMEAREREMLSALGYPDPYEAAP